MKFRLITKRQIWVILLALFLVSMLIDLNTRVSTLNYLRSQKKTLEADVSNLQSTLEVVSEQIDYADSETAVEAWARQQGMMMKEGDNVIIPLPGGGPTPQPTPIPTVEPIEYKNWEVWKALIFD